MVYHGFAGHFFVKDVAHVLKVLIIADMDERVAVVMNMNGISREEAIQYIKKLDDHRKKWSQQLYGIEASDPSLYDLVVHIDKITVADAVDIICHKVVLRRFQTTPESQQKIEDLSLAAEVKASLIELKPDVNVEAQEGSVRVTANASAAQKLKLEEEMRKIAEANPAIKNLQFNPQPITPYAID